MRTVLNRHYSALCRWTRPPTSNERLSNTTKQDCLQMISSAVLVPKSTVADIVKVFSVSGNFDSRRQGTCVRKRKLTKREGRLVARYSSLHPQETARQLQETIGGSLKQVSLSTIRRTLSRQSIFAYRHVAAPQLTPAAQLKRL